MGAASVQAWQEPILLGMRVGSQEGGTGPILSVSLLPRTSRQAARGCSQHQEALRRGISQVIGPGF